MYSGRETLPYLDKTLPEAWKAATAFSTAVSDEALRQGLARTESELIKLRVSVNWIYKRNSPPQSGRPAGRLTDVDVDAHVIPVEQDPLTFVCSLRVRRESLAVAHRPRTSIIDDQARAIRRHQMSGQLDGNSHAGPLSDTFRFDPTVAVGLCGACGGTGPVLEHPGLDIAALHHRG